MKQYVFIKFLLLLLCWSFSVVESWGQEENTQNTQQSAQPEPPKTFIFDENTGEVHGCNLIQMIEESQGRVFYNSVNSNIDEKEKKIKLLKKLFPKLFSNESYYNIVFDKRENNFVLYEFVDGGVLLKIFFFNKQNKLLKSFSLPKHHVFRIQTIEFNEANTFFMLASRRGLFYIFSPTGKVVTTGDYCKIAQVKYDNIIHFNVDKKGDIIIINSLILSKDLTIKAIMPPTAGSSYIDENKGLIYTNAGSRLNIYDKNSLKLLYQSNVIRYGPNIANKQIYFQNSLNLNQKYFYEITN